MSIKNNPNYNLPASPEAGIFGREAFLARLHETLQAKASTETMSASSGSEHHVAGADSVSVHIIGGPGGIGKTSVAMEYGHRYRADYTAVLFIRAATRETFEIELANLAGKAGVSLPDIFTFSPIEYLDELARWFRDHPRWLLILDGADSREAARAVEARLPLLKGGDVLITSRLTDWMPGVDQFNLEVLSPDDAACFLQESARPERKPASGDFQDAAALAHKLDCFPLALQLAAAHIHRQGIGFASYLERWEKQENNSELLNWYNDRFAHEFEYKYSLCVTLATSFQELSSQAKALLELLSYLAPAPIPFGLLKTDLVPVLLAEAIATSVPPVLSNTDVQEALNELSAYSFITSPDSSSEIFSVHQAVQEIVRNRLPHQTSSIRWMQTVRAVEAFVPEFEDESIWTRLAEHMEVLFEHAVSQEDPEPIPDLLESYSQFLFDCRLSNERAELLFRRAIQSLERTLGPEHPYTLTFLNNFALMKSSAGDDDAAELIMRQILAASERVHGLEHEDTLMITRNLAGLFESKQEYGTAESLYRQVLEIREQLLGPEHPDTLISLNDLANLMRIKGNYEAAEQILNQVMEICYRTLGPFHEITMASKSNLGVVYNAKGNHEAAKELMLSTWICTTTLGNIPQLLGYTRDPKESELYYRQKMESREQALGPEHPETLKSINNLAFLLETKGDNEAAEPLYRRAVEVSTRVLGPGHSDTQTYIRNLTSLLNREKKE